MTGPVLIKGVGGSARVTSVKGAWGYWISGKRTQSDQWSRDDAILAAAEAVSS